MTKTTLKEFDVKVRFDKELHEQLLQYCEEHEITKADEVGRADEQLQGLR